MELYEIAKPFGRPRKFKSAEQLWDAFVRYTQWNDGNPITVYNYQEAAMEGKGKTTPDSQRRRQATLRRPMSLTAFRLHAGIKRDWATFKADYLVRGESFRGVINTIEDAVRQQMVDGALVGNYKENLVARLNGISDSIKQEVKADVKERKELSVQEAREYMNKLEEEI